MGVWETFYILNLVTTVVFFPTSAVAVITPDRSPRPTSAPAIAQSHVAEPTPPAASAFKEMEVVSKKEKEAAKTEVKHEEMPSDKAKMEPAEVTKVC